MSTDTATDAELVEAIHSQQVVARFAQAATGSRGDIARAVEACRAIGRRMVHECERVVDVLGAAGITATVVSGDEPRQIHQGTVSVSGVGNAQRAVELLATRGWSRHHAWSAGADRSFWNNSREVLLLRHADATLALDLRFDGDRADTRVARLLRPGSADWYSIGLPRSLWWAYRLVRPLRLVATRLGAPTPAVPAPFLSTPDDLINPLLEAVTLRPEDVVMDLGCGDGRLVLAAAERTGCRAIGVERVAERVELARRRCAGSAASDRIEIRSGDAFTTDVSEVTVVLMFLPLDAVADTLPDLLARLAPRARVLAHEQLPLPARLEPRPDRSLPVIGPRSLTVAHLWVTA